MDEPDGPGTAMTSGQDDGHGHDRPAGPGHDLLDLTISGGEAWDRLGGGGETAG